MSRRGFSAACALIVGGAAAIAAVVPALAGGRHGGYEEGAAWYDQEPWAGTATGYYYRHHPTHIPAYPKPLTGYPVPIYDEHRPLVQVVRTYRVTASAHARWCKARYLSYDVRSDTYQPYRGPRRQCRSPYG